MTVRQLFSQAKSLSAIERAKLAELILTDLDKPDESIEKQWVKEVIRRRDSVNSGKVKLKTYQQVMGKYK